MLFFVLYVIPGIYYVLRGDINGIHAPVTILYCFCTVGLAVGLYENAWRIIVQSKMDSDAVKPEAYFFAGLFTLISLVFSVGVFVIATNWWPFFAGYTIAVTLIRIATRVTPISIADN